VFRRIKYAPSQRPVEEATWQGSLFPLFFAANYQPLISPSYAEIVSEGSNAFGILSSQKSRKIGVTSGGFAVLSFSEPSAGQISAQARVNLHITRYHKGGYLSK
jgi:hypothetical protein